MIELKTQYKESNTRSPLGPDFGQEYSKFTTFFQKCVAFLFHTRLARQRNQYSIGSQQTAQSRSCTTKTLQKHTHMLKGSTKGIYTTSIQEYAEDTILF